MRPVLVQRVNNHTARFAKGFPRQFPRFNNLVSGLRPLPAPAASPNNLRLFTYSLRGGNRESTQEPPQRHIMTASETQQIVHRRIRSAAMLCKMPHLQLRSSVNRNEVLGPDG